MADLKPLVVRLSDGGARFQRLLAGAGDTAGMKSGYMTLKPCESVGEHSTENREEALIILEGEARISFDGRAEVSAPAGSLVYIPAQTRHDVRNEGPGLLRYIYVVK
jgi:mannose-6-phosphate isomerase-like protein (cupin superfamily)